MDCRKQLDKFIGNKNDYHDFNYYLENLEMSEPKDDMVPDSVFFLLDTERNILLGAVNIRHCLNDYLLKYGGHIGDGIDLQLPKKCVFAFLGDYIDGYAHKTDTRQVSSFISATKHYPIYLTRIV